MVIRETFSNDVVVAMPKATNKRGKLRVARERANRSRTQASTLRNTGASSPESCSVIKAKMVTSDRLCTFIPGVADTTRASYTYTYITHIVYACM